MRYINRAEVLNRIAKAESMAIHTTSDSEFLRYERQARSLRAILAPLSTDEETAIRQPCCPTCGSNADYQLSEYDTEMMRAFNAGAGVSNLETWYCAECDTKNLQRC